MIRRAVTVLFICWCSILALCAQNLLILYDGEIKKSEAYQSAKFTANLLGHFSLKEIDIIHFSQYQALLEQKFQYLVIISDEGSSQFPQSLLADLAERQDTILWINMNLDKLLEIESKTYGIEYVDMVKKENWQINFRGFKFTKEDPWINVINIKDAEHVKVLSFARDASGTKYPYVIQTGNLWYMADSPYSYASEGGRFLILAELFHDILKQNHEQNHRALVRIEDVNALSKPEELRNIADMLYEEKVPFQISVVPIYSSPDTRSDIYLSDVPQMVEALRYAVTKDASIVMHGVTHQFRGASTDDFEFWDSISGKPLGNFSEEWVTRKLRMGIEELLKCQLLPLAWETPHYTASQQHYRVISKYFDTFYERMMVENFAGSQQIIPFVIRSRDYPITLIPENLGYVEYTKPEDNSILDQARLLKVVRDGVASFYFHPFVQIAHLKKIVQEMKGMGWRFISLKDYPCNVKTESHWITSAGGTRNLTLANQYYQDILIDDQGEVKRKNLSKKRQTRIIKKSIQLPKQHTFAMQALDSLPFPAKQQTPTESEDPLRLSRALILIKKSPSVEEKNNQESYISIFNIFGFSPIVHTLGTQKKFSVKDHNLIIIPNATANELMEIEMNIVLDFVEQGGILITDGQSNLARKFNLRFTEDKVSVSEIKDLTLPVENIFWPTPRLVPQISGSNITILAQDTKSHTPLALIKPFGNGRILFLSAPLDPYTPYGLSHYPYLPYYLKNELGIGFHLRSKSLEFYFDPGLRPNAIWEKLVQQWRLSGVKIIYLAAWHFYKNYQFDYKYFIDLCHRSGIAVYAWFEFPQVTHKFWSDNPDWREKDSLNRDARSGWRLQMNLYNPEVRQAAAEFFKWILLEFNWDGINFAELSYDTNKGLNDPDKFAPLNKDIRNEFKRETGVDAIEIFKRNSPHYWQKSKKTFNRFVEFRTRIIKSLHIFFLDQIKMLQKQKQKEMEVIVTVLDSLNHPEIIEDCGVNILDIIELMDRYNFTLQVEDPSRSWINIPSRYRSYVDKYRPHIKNIRKLMFDINVVKRPKYRRSNLPSSLAVGTELATTFYYATQISNRVGIYSEATVKAIDMLLLSYVVGPKIKISERKSDFIIHTPKPVELILNKQYRYHPRINDEVWPFYSNNIISIPTGTNILSLQKSNLPEKATSITQILFNGDLSDLTTFGNILSFRYSSITPVTLSYGHNLDKIRIDSKEIIEANPGSNRVLPFGNHRVELFIHSHISEEVEMVGYFTSTIFYIFGLIAVSLLVLLYIFSRFKRRKQ